ncbi:MAG: sugar isomerase domain-containing protein [Erysipelotrichaceae bacterium]|nr:sugar isomerase domain-containing protein [Erysipelotrichaceae bacterium]
MNNVKKYFEVVQNYLDLIEKSSEDDVKKAALILAECFQNNGVCQLFGVKHGLEFSMELGYRAGGLMPFHRFNVTDLVLKGILTEEEMNDPAVYDRCELVEKLMEIYNVYPEDMFLITSSSGTEGVVVEAALLAKKQGRKVIAVVNGNEVKVSKSHHPSGKNLVEVADLVIDTHAPYPDVNIELADGQKMCQVSTICGNIIAQMITGETYRYFVENGLDCPVLLSANVKGADVHNRQISDKYLGRWNSI